MSFSARKAWRRLEGMAKRAAAGRPDVAELVRAHKAASAARPAPVADGAQGEAAELLTLTETWLRGSAGKRAEVAERLGFLAHLIGEELDASTPQLAFRRDVDG